MNVNLIIEDQFCDIDSGVNISVTDSIANAKEPDKVFGVYSNTFLLPATQQNGKIFGRWEQEANKSSWDARYSADAEIQINGALKSIFCRMIKYLQLRNSIMKF